MYTYVHIYMHTHIYDIALYIHTHIYRSLSLSIYTYILHAVVEARETVWLRQAGDQGLEPIYMCEYNDNPDYYY